MKYNLKIILASTRPGRKGIAVARWIEEIVGQDDRWEVEFLDLKKVDLPFLDEAAHPRLRKYEHDHTHDWSRSIDEADAFIFVTAEYNHLPPPTLLNAVNFLNQEWSEKPVGFVSYGGVSGGTRAVEALIPGITALGMMPMPLAVNIPFFAKFIDDHGSFNADKVQVKAAQNMLNQLHRWTRALTQMRRSGQD